MNRSRCPSFSTAASSTHAAVPLAPAAAAPCARLTSSGQRMIAECDQDRTKQEREDDFTNER